MHEILSRIRPATATGSGCSGRPALHDHIIFFFFLFQSFSKLFRLAANSDVKKDTTAITGEVYIDGAVNNRERPRSRLHARDGRRGDDCCTRIEAEAAPVDGNGRIDADAAPSRDDDNSVRSVGRIRRRQRARKGRRWWNKARLPVAVVRRIRLVARLGELVAAAGNARDAPREACAQRIGAAVSLRGGEVRAGGDAAVVAVGVATGRARRPIATARDVPQASGAPPPLPLPLPPQGACTDASGSSSHHPTIVVRLIASASQRAQMAVADAALRSVMPKSIARCGYA